MVCGVSIQPSCQRNVTDLALRDSIAGDEELWENVVEVPPERFALEMVPQCLPVGDVAKITLNNTMRIL